MCLLSQHSITQTGKGFETDRVKNLRGVVFYLHKFSCYDNSSVSNIQVHILNGDSFSNNVI